MKMPESEIVYLKGLRKDGVWVHVFSLSQEHLAEETASVIGAKIEPYPVRFSYENVSEAEFKVLIDTFRGWKAERSK